MAIAESGPLQRTLYHHRGAKIGWYIHALLVVLLVSRKMSTATYNPTQHPQNSGWRPTQTQMQFQSSEPEGISQQPHQPRHVHWEGPSRGGSTAMAPTLGQDDSTMAHTHQPHPSEHHQQQQQLGQPDELREQQIHQSQLQEPHLEEPYSPPKVLLKHMSIALRVTSEWNRRLLNGVNRFKFWKRKYDLAEPLSDNASHENHYHRPVNVHPSRPWHPPIPPTSVHSLLNEQNELTLFHAKSPRVAQSTTYERQSPEKGKTVGDLKDDENETLRGVARWGPELLPYLEHIVEVLGISADGVEIPLAMIYLDRACSVETPRSSGIPSCPFCTPRTVHRLSLASLSLATQAVKGLSEPEMQVLYQKFESLGIPKGQLQQMVEWMRGALGDQGMMVTIPQMKEWGNHWESTFSRHALFQQAPDQQLE